MRLEYKLEKIKVADVLNIVGYNELKYVVSPLSPAIIAAMHIASLDVEAVTVAESRKKVYGIFTGYSLLRLIEGNKNNPWEALYRVSCASACGPTLEMSYDNTLAELLQGMLVSGNGCSVVTRNYESIATLGTLGIAKFFHATRFLKDLEEEIPLKRIANRDELVKIEPDTPIHELIDFMIQTRIGHLLIQDEAPKIITDRNLAEYLLDKRTIIQFRDDACLVMERKVGDVLSYCHEPAFLSPDTGINNVLEALLRNKSRTVVTDDMKQITTSWDITVGLYKETNPLNIN